MGVGEKVSVDVEPENIIRRTADDRGRVTLGADYAGEDVRLALVEVNADD